MWRWEVSVIRVVLSSRPLICQTHARHQIIQVVSLSFVDVLDMVVNFRGYLSDNRVSFFFLLIHWWKHYLLHMGRRGLVKIMKDVQVRKWIALDFSRTEKKKPMHKTVASKFFFFNHFIKYLSLPCFLVLPLASRKFFILVCLLIFKFWFSFPCFCTVTYGVFTVEIQNSLVRASQPIVRNLNYRK